jgi:histidyl-tRNA synthetase
VLRSLDKLAKIGRQAVIDELSKASETGGAGLTGDQATELLDFAEQGRGGIDVLQFAEARLGAHPRAAEGIANLRTVLDLLSAAGIPADRIALDLGLARGLDYYTGIVFETTVKGYEQFGSIASGGRYDNLASLFTTRRLPGVGASIGLDRLLALLADAKRLGASGTTAPVLVANFPGTDPAIPFRLAARLRAVGIGAEVYPEPIQIGKQMGYGSNKGHRFAVIVGPDEAARETFNLRNLATRHEEKGLSWSVLEATVRESLEVLEREGARS